MDQFKAGDMVRFQIICSQRGYHWVIRWNYNEDNLPAVNIINYRYGWDIGWTTGLEPGYDIRVAYGTVTSASSEKFTVRWIEPHYGDSRVDSWPQPGHPKARYGSEGYLESAGKYFR
jgi:hypothetical protein